MCARLWLCGLSAAQAQPRAASPLLVLCLCTRVVHMCVVVCVCLSFDRCRCCLRQPAAAVGQLCSARQRPSRRALTQHSTAATSLDEPHRHHPGRRGGQREREVTARHSTTTRTNNNQQQVKRERANEMTSHSYDSDDSALSFSPRLRGWTSSSRSQFQPAHTDRIERRGRDLALTTAPPRTHATRLTLSDTCAPL